VQQLATNIETTQGVLELTLDNERNRIARLELILSMAGLAIGAAACVSSFFGMNLISGLEVSKGKSTKSKRMGGGRGRDRRGKACVSSFFGMNLISGMDVWKAGQP
jgi:Mg2+ and Co2+ transporter CorA